MLALLSSGPWVYGFKTPTPEKLMISTFDEILIHYLFSGHANLSCQNWQLRLKTSDTVRKLFLNKTNLGHDQNKYVRPPRD